MKVDFSAYQPLKPCGFKEQKPFLQKREEYIHKAKSGIDSLCEIACFSHAQKNAIMSRKENLLDNLADAATIRTHQLSIITKMQYAAEDFFNEHLKAMQDRNPRQGLVMAELEQAWTKVTSLVRMAQHIEKLDSMAVALGGSAVRGEAIQKDYKEVSRLMGRAGGLHFFKVNLLALAKYAKANICNVTQASSMSSSSSSSAPVPVSQASVQGYAEESVVEARAASRNPAMVVPEVSGARYVRVQDLKPGIVGPWQINVFVSKKRFTQQVQVSS